jgi:protein-S-isoprenylcysteine O-methyltransferase Ste14
VTWLNPCGREARSAPASWNVAKTLAQTVLFWLTFLFILPAGIYQLERVAGLDGLRFAGPATRVASVLLFVVAGAFSLTSGVVMAVRGRGTPLPADCPRALVVAGPYRYVRNPMAIAGLSQGAAVGLYVGSPLILAYVVAGALLWNYVVRPWEEADLERRFGEPFRGYRRSVRCWWPQVRPYAPPAPAQTPDPSADEAVAARPAAR